MVDDALIEHVAYVQAEYLLSDRLDFFCCLHPKQIRGLEKLVAYHDREKCEYCKTEVDHGDEG